VKRGMPCKICLCNFCVCLRGLEWALTDHKVLLDTVLGMETTVDDG
jgi:hypothetical protein